MSQKLQIYTFSLFLDQRALINASSPKAFKTLELNPKPSEESMIKVTQKNSVPVNGSQLLKIFQKTNKIDFICHIDKIATSKNSKQLFSDQDYADLIKYNRR